MPDDADLLDDFVADLHEGLAIPPPEPAAILVQRRQGRKERGVEEFIRLTLREFQGTGD